MLLYLRDSIVTKFASYYFNVLVIILAKNGFPFDFPTDMANLFTVRDLKWLANL